MIPLLFSYLKQYWKKQTIKEKTFILLLIIATLIISYISLQKVYYKYQLTKARAERVELLENALEEITKRYSDVLLEGEKTTKQVQKKASAIDKKLQDDEKTIDNSTVTDAQLREFLSKYE